MTNNYRISARGKINLCLDVLSKREDGYHNISTIMQSFELCDEITLKKVFKKNYFKVITNLSYLPCDERNIVYKAAKYLTDNYVNDNSYGIFIDLKKKVPVSAGLGGGSSDCAATLKIVNEFLNLDIAYKDLIRIGAKFGADVSFFFLEGTVKAEGIGEILTRIPELPKCYIILAKPPIIVSTADVFKKFNNNLVRNRPDIEKLIYYLIRQDIYNIGKNFVNVLETVTSNEYPIIENMKQFLLEQGAFGAMMSGSGPTVFGCFSTKEIAFEAFCKFKSSFPDIKECFLTKSYN